MVHTRLPTVNGAYAAFSRPDASLQRIAGERGELQMGFVRRGSEWVFHDRLSFEPRRVMKSVPHRGRGCVKTRPRLAKINCSAKVSV